MPCTLKCLFVLAVVCAGFPVAALAQITSVNNETSTPIQGAGHDYIKLFSETVNPANGSVSIRVQVPSPPGRKLSLPFSFAYDSDGAEHLMSDGFGGLYRKDNAAYLSKGGWSYSVPLISTVQVQETTPGYGGPGTRCVYYDDYLFQEATGTRHSLFLSFVPTPSPQCAYAQPIVPVAQLSGGDDYFLAQLPSSSTSPLLVADADGTVYTFPALGRTHLVPYNDAFGSSLPSLIEDRNGNKITITDLGAQGGANGAFTVSDTLARTLISSSGFGSTGNTVSVSGASNPYAVTWGAIGAGSQAVGSVLIWASANGCNNIPGLGGGASVITQINLPNNTSYIFSYDGNYGLLNKITYPSGGYVSYVWGLNPLSEFASFEDIGGATLSGCLYHYDSPAVTHRYVSFDGVHVALQQDFSYSTTWSTSSSWATKTTTVTTTDLVTGAVSSTVYTYSPYTPNSQPNDQTYFAPQLPLEQSVVYKDSTGTTLRTVNKTWYDQFQLKSQQTVLENGLTSELDYSYGPGAQVVSEEDFDFGNGTPGRRLRKTAYTYQAFNATPLFPSAPSIFDRRCKAVIYDSTATNIVAETDYLYDGATGTTPCGMATTQALPGTGSYTGHDETLYSTGASVPRGNLTKVINQCLQGAQACASGNPTTTFTYDETGQVLSTTSPSSPSCPSGCTTIFSYADSYTILSGGANINYPPSGNTNALLTKITDPFSHTQFFTYDYNNGQLTIAKDQNNQITSYIYNDTFARPTQISYADGGLTAVSYTDSAPSPSVTTSKKIDISSRFLTSVTVLDGLGHVVQTQLCEDGSACTQLIKTDTTYDGLGRVWKQSNPHRTAASSTDGTTIFTNDALGRTNQVTQADGSLITTSYSANTVTVTDEAGKKRKSQTDALGRLTQVFEDPAGSNYETDYQYDTLDNLVRVDQKGNDPNSGNWRTQLFTYNSLSQLLTASNPESGSITYAYNNDGTLATKVAPAPNQTGSATVTTTYSYDALHRLIQKSFSDSTPVVKYGYDGVVPSGCTPPTLAITNGIGRRTSTCDAAGSEAWSYDAMGRPLTDRRTTNSVTKDALYTYNLDGSLATLTYPSTRVLSYAYNAAARAISAVDAANNITYATSATYAPHGALASVQNGGSLYSAFLYNQRLQPCWLYSTTVSTGAPTACAQAGIANAAILDYQYDFALGVSDNGNVTKITNRRDTARSANFTYDSLNRIATAFSDGNLWGETFQIDPWGNLNKILACCGKPQTENLNQMAGPNNRFTGMTYDAAGNLLNDGLTNYTFNAENQIASINGGSVTYSYDGDGKRVQKSNGKLYWYGAGSDPLDETDAAGNTNNASFKEYVFFGGKRIARRDYQNNVSYYFADHLGTARVVTNAGGTILDDSDFYPFGGERAVLSSSGNRYKFTGKERDSESGLDNFGARYNASTMGRFMTPDSPSYSNSKNPQSWNLYAYSLNNPVSFRDADGHEIVCANNAEQCKKDAAAATANAEAAKRVTTNTETTKHSFLGIKWTTTKTTIGITGDIKSFRALSANASKLADLVTDSRTVTVSYDNLARQSSWDTGLPLNGGSTSYMNPFLAIIDPNRTAGAVYDPDAVAQKIPQANTAEEFGHEVLGHIWGDMIGGHPAGTRANMRDSIIGEDAVRALDPTRGQKGIESHHNYNEMPPDNYKPPKQ